MPHKYTRLKKQKNKIKRKQKQENAGGAVLCIFGLKSQLSGKQTVDWFVSDIVLSLQKSKMNREVNSVCLHVYS